MFDFLRNLTKSVEEKRQEQLHAYLDNALAPRERQQFEQELAQDAALRAEMDDLRQMKQQLRELPRRPVPRSFTLDPAVYGRPARQPLFQFYPVLQGATVLTALFFILALSLTLFQPQAQNDTVASATQNAASQEMAAATEAPAPESSTLYSTGEIAEEESAADTSSETMQTEAEAAADEEMLEEEATAEMATEKPPMAEESASADSGEEGVVSDTVASVPVVTANQATPTALTTLAAPTTTPMATPTASEPPRPATQTADNRSLEAQPTLSAADDQATDAASSNMAEPQSLPTTVPPSITLVDGTSVPPLRIAQVALGALLILFGALTFYVRRYS